MKKEMKNLTMPCTFSKVENDEMTYIDGGMVGSAKWKLGTLKEALRSLMLSGLTISLAKAFGVTLYSFSAAYSWAYHGSSAYNVCDWLINNYGANRMGLVTTAYTATGTITGMSVGLLP